MREVYGLIIVLLMLGPIGMGILFNVDAPLMQDASLTEDGNQVSIEDHGTRAIPEGIPTNVRLYFHRSGNTMNTSDIGFIPATEGAGLITFTLQDPLINDLLVEDSLGEAGMVAELMISGQGWVDISVFDNDDTTLVGSGSYGSITSPFDHSVPTVVPIPVPFEPAWDHNYTFDVNHQIIIEINFGISAGRLHYDSLGRSSSLRLWCTPVIDITAGTYNFFSDPLKLFYPNDINFPEERKKVEVMGVVTDVFGKFDKKYISRAEVQIEGPGLNQTYNAGWSRNRMEYSYTWLYPANQTSGEYIATAHIFDQQNNEFTVTTAFNMSDYGVLLTSPSQVGGEGSYQTDLAKAKRNVVQNNETKYHINVWNIGGFPTGVSLTTSGPDEWDWWFEGENLTVENLDTGTILNIDPDDSKGVKLVVDSKNNPLDDKATISVTATPTGDTSLDSILTTITKVVLKYNVDLRFSDGTNLPKQKTVEIGGEVTYDFSVSNTGGADDSIWIDFGTGPSGWQTTLEGDDLKSSVGRYYVYLVSGHSTDLTLTVKASSEGGDETVNIDIIGTSQGSQDQGDDPIASDRLTTITKKTSGMKLELISDGVLEVDPEDQVSYLFQLTNTGTSSNNFTASYTGPDLSEGWDTEDISFSQNSYVPEQKYSNLAQNAQQVITLWVKPTMEILSGNYSITVRVERDDSPLTRNDEKTVYCLINEIFEIELIDPSPFQPELNTEAEPGEDVEFTIRIKNSGNTQEKVSIHVDRPSDWDLFFDNASSTWEENLDPQQDEEITMVLTVPEDAEGDKTVDITISVEPAESDTIFIETHIKIKSFWYEPIITLLVPILLFVVIIVMVIVIYKRR
ncbi:MAG: hypothetical protein JSV09_07795 [Thermoplasmata archaeon]|nr:MAG: hypothetical protein JSV09_07795 [Thermoplasmata archaeon]